jgi:predicted Rossmann-fold nucleotide-binding protein
MAKRVGAFVGLPGGFGTFEEVRDAHLFNSCPPHRAFRSSKL